MPSAARPLKAQHAPDDADGAPRKPATLEEQKKAFLRLVSHELRTPLNSILGFSEILSAELYGPLGAAQYKEYAGIIGDSGRKLLRLINQVLEIGRLEGIRLDLRPEPLEPAFADAIATTAADIAECGVRPRVIAAGPLPLV